MKDFAGRVAVVTGAASGIGLAFAHQFADEGMNLVLADIESEPLAMAEAALKAKGARTVAVRTNVMHAEEIERLADAAFAAFGNVHVLCNNAGVTGGYGLGGAAWEIPAEEWDWVLNVNLMGVLHGVRAFVPRMLANGEEGHVVNTASGAGLLTAANPYGVSKHGVVCLTEGIYKDFKTRGTKLSATVVCPGWVNTSIMDAERNRPAEFGPAMDRSRLPQDQQQFMAAVKAFVKDGYSPADVALQVFEAIRDDRFYVIPAQPEIVALIHLRLEDIRLQRNPTIMPIGD